jgi:hypothetical protein
MGNFASPVAQNINGKRPPLSDVTNVSPSEGPPAVSHTGVNPAYAKRIKVDGDFQEEVFQGQQLTVEQQELQHQYDIA